MDRPPLDDHCGRCVGAGVCTLAGSLTTSITFRGRLVPVCAGISPTISDWLAAPGRSWAASSRPLYAFSPSSASWDSKVLTFLSRRRAHFDELPRQFERSTTGGNPASALCGRDKHSRELFRPILSQTCRACSCSGRSPSHAQAASSAWRAGHFLFLLSACVLSYVGLRVVRLSTSGRSF